MLYSPGWPSCRSISAGQGSSGRKSLEERRHVGVVCTFQKRNDRDWIMALVAGGGGGRVLGGAGGLGHHGDRKCPPTPWSLSPGNFSSPGQSSQTVEILGHLAGPLRQGL